MKKLKKQNKLGKKKGFTLIEMIIVIVIIGILAAAILPKILGARDRATDIAIKSDLKNIATALEIYYMDNGTYKVEGGGREGEGQGRFFYEGESYPKSIQHVLEEQGYLQPGMRGKGGNPKDNLPTNKPEYMLYLCNEDQGYSLSAKLLNPTKEDIAYIKTEGCNFKSPRYRGMNYAITGGR